MIDSHDKLLALNGVKTPSSLMSLPYLSKGTEGLKEFMITSQMLERKERLELFLEDTYLCDFATGETYPCYAVVPCGHCDVCNARKLTSYIQRCQFAHEEALGSSFFFTLTYNDDNLPSDGVSKDDVQRFKKRLKRTVELYLNDEELAELKNEAKFNGMDEKEYIEDKYVARGSQAATKMKFIVTAEYTPKNHRPHYHGICFGMPVLSPHQDRDDFLRTKMFQFCWRNNELDMDAVMSSGLTRYKSFRQYCAEYPLMRNIPKDYDPYSMGYCSIGNTTCGDGPIRYILKYAFKMQFDDNCNVPPGKNPLFKSVSCNLGLQWLKEHACQIGNDGKLRYCSVSDLALKEVNLSGYYIAKLYPSVSKLIPVNVRKAYLEIQSFISMLDRYDLNNGVKASCLASKVYIDNKYPFLNLFNDTFFIDFKKDKLIQNPEKIRDLICDTALYDKWKDGYVTEVKLQLIEFAKNVDVILNANIDYDYVIEKLRERAFYLARIKPLDPGLSHDAGQRFRRDIKVARSKETELQ